jgi:hypothetical protein
VLDFLVLSPLLLMSSACRGLCWSGAHAKGYRFIVLFRTFVLYTSIWRQDGDNADALFLFFRCIERMERSGVRGGDRIENPDGPGVLYF